MLTASGRQPLHAPRAAGPERSASAPDSQSVVLSVTALGDTIEDAQKKAYRAMGMIHFEGMHYRRDIGQE